ncbi:MAG: hypothetical protein JWN75_767 [Candidatus Saccharibacteria bacterium]|nr:hypothetical protein [Candidatus Saccharibacteria bacterium]
MGQINRGEDKQKIVLRVRFHKPDFANLGKTLLLAPKKWINKLLNMRLRYRFIIAVVVLILAEVYSVLTPYFQDGAYALGNGQGLLMESSQEMAAKIQFDQTQQTFNFNAQTQQANPEEAGATTLASAVAHKDPAKGVTVTDTKNKVTFTMIPKFRMDSGRQDKDRIVYPLADGNGFAVYTMRGIGVKEDIILNSSAKDTASYSYTLQIDSKLSPKIEQDGSIGIYGNTLFSGDVSTGSAKDAALLEKARKNAPKDTLLFKIPPPVVNDKHGPANGITAKYSLNGDELTVTATGLKKGNYPISIDPSIYVATAQQFMAGNNETNINFDVDNKLIKKGRTTGARFDAWNSTTGLSQKMWGASTAAAGGYIYSIGGTSYSGQLYTSQGTSSYTVPTGVTSITVKAWGAGGGGGAGGGTGAGGAGGGGGYVTTTISVTPGETLNVYVGGGGGAGTRNTGGGGGGGGSFSGIARGAVPLAIAAGGAGGGGGNNAAARTGGAGGAGGGTTGVTGGSAGGTAPVPTGGTGGTPSSGGGVGTNGTNVGGGGGYLQGGLGGDGRNAAGADGSAANGGNPNGGAGGSVITTTYAGGGGGGGGYYGGAGGNGSTTTTGASGGGGGSSYTTGTSSTNTVGSGTTPGNPSDTDRNGAAGGGTAGAVAGVGTAGSNGLVNITYGSGTTSNSSAINWAQFNTGTGTIDSPNPGQGACSGWCTTAGYNLPDGRSNFSLVAYNGFLYVMGGTSANCTAGNSTGTSGYCNTVYISKLGANGEPQLWHPTDTNPANAVYWYKDTNLPTDRAYSSAVAYNNRMYFMGGRNSSGITNVTHIADITPNGKLGTWTASTVLPSNLYGHDTQVYNDRIYVIGGSSSVGGAPSNSVYYNKINADGTLNAWVQTTSFITGRLNQGGNMTVVWGAYMYISGGCNTVNASGYCTSVSSNSQVASINADGSLDTWNSMTGLSDTRMSHSLVAWRDKVYEIGGCSAQTASTGDCNTGMLDTIKYGKINQDGDASTVSQSVNASTSPCNATTPTNCDLPGTTYIGNMLAAAVITNGYLYIIGGCNDVATTNCATTTGNVAYVSISSTGKMVKPASCPTGTYRGNAWCVDTTNTVSGGIAASSPVVFGGRIYLVGGMTGSGNKDAVLRSTVNNNGSLSSWTSQQLSGSTNLNAQSVTYNYAFARANPSNATTYPGNLYILGGCTTSSAAGCSAYTDAVYKCNIKADGSIDTGTTNGCSTSNQLQIGILPGGTNAGLAIMSGAVYANYIYLIGGASQDLQDLNTVRYAKIDNSNNIVAASGSAWTQSSSLMNVGRRRAAAFGYNGYLYIVGGYDTTAGVLPDIEFIKINVSDGSLVGDASNSSKWYKSTVQINQRWGLSVPVSNSYAYVIGGCTTGASPASCTAKTDTVQTFQLYNNDSGAPAGFTTASTYATNPTRIGISSAVLNGKIYVAGGCTMSGTCTDAVNTVSYASLDAYGALSSWTDTTAALPADRAWGSLKIAGGSLYYIGGHSDTPSDSRTEVYYSTPSSGDVTSWSTASNGLPNARAKFGATVWDNRLYIVGGEGSGTGCSGGICNTIYVSPQLNSGGNITSAWSTSSTSFNVARSGTTAVAYANNLYIFGGYDGTNYLSDSQYSQLSSSGTAGSWTYSTSLPRPLAQGDGFAANGYIYLLGGRSTDTSCNPVELIAPISANTTIASGNNPTGVGSWYEANERYAGPRYGNTANYYDGKAYVLGGLNCAPGATFTTAGANSYTVPSGVYSINVKVWGGGGGGGASAGANNGGAGGGSGYVSSTLTTTPGETLTINVGGGGGGGGIGGNGGGQGGGGGGGYSSINRSATPLVIGAGGGGGGGANSAAGTGGAGGAGGGTTGATGATNGAHIGGDGGTQSAGGAGGAGGGGCAGYAGSSLTGGIGAYYNFGCVATTQANGGITTGGAGGLYGNSGGGGGGGGAGYFGGGAGGGIGATGGAGGGGGSSYTTGTNTSNTIGSGAAPGNSGDSDRGSAGSGGGGATGSTVAGSAGGAGKVIIDEFSAVQQTALLTQPQVAKYSIMIDTDSDVFPTNWLLNGVDNSVGAKWQLKYRSMTNNAATLCTTPVMTTWGRDTTFSNVTLGLPGIYTPLNSSGTTTDCARYYNFTVNVDSQNAFGYPDDVTRGPTITDLTLNFKADPAKRLLHGRTFTGGLQMPIDTPYNSN